MKHAYLILAHNEFGVLQELINALDVKENDIYIHIDKKIKILPDIRTCESSLYILDDRINVKWGHISMIESEYKLFEAAFASKVNYAYYHLISGVHFPLKAQSEIHEYFNQEKGKSILSPLPWNESEINKKIGFYHFFASGIKDESKLIRITSNLLWRFFLRIQKNIISRNTNKFSGKYSNWVSISSKDVIYILNFKDKVLKSFKYTLCPDELFIPYIFKINNIEFIERNLLFQEFIKASPKILNHSDFETIIESKALFARKFNNESIDIINKIKNRWQNK